MHSESELLEEEVNVGLFIVAVIRVGEPALEEVLKLLLDGLTALSSSHLLFANIVLKFFVTGGELTSNGESGGHQMVVVDILNERLNSGTLLLFLLGHLLMDLQRSSLNTGDEGVGELLASLLGSIIVRLDDNGLLACSSTSE